MNTPPSYIHVDKNPHTFFNGGLAKPAGVGYGLVIATCGNNVDLILCPSPNHS